MTYSFAGGVRDAEGRRGYVAVGPAVTALDLAAGTVLWRRAGIGRPLAATPTRLLTLDRDGPRYVLRLLDAGTGADTGRITSVGLPDWAADAGIEADAVQIEASENPGGIQLTWAVRRPYRGGAAPPPGILAKARDTHVGAVVVDPDSGQVTTASPAANPPEAPSLESRDLGPHAMPSPDVLAFERIGDRLFALKAQTRPGQPMRVALEARDARSGSTLWEAPLAETDPPRPTPPRK